MKRLLGIHVSLLIIVTAQQAQAGLNLGMKLACKRYGEAWNSGSKHAMFGVATGDFASVWSRIPDEAFRTMPRGGGGRVLGSSKGRGSGTVTVATSQGVVTFVLVGRGFQWTVADIYKAGDDGQTVSLKNYLDASLTAREFIVRLKQDEGERYQQSITQEFREAFARLDDGQVNRLRSFLPDPDYRLRPHLTFRGDRATMRVPVPNGGPDDHTVFELVREGGWRVADYSVHTETTTIPSFRRGLGAVACLTAFRAFTAEPAANDPVEFTAEGDLRDALVQVRAEEPFPLRPQGERKKVVISEEGDSVLIQYSDRDVRISLCPESPKAVVKSVEVSVAGKWTDLSQLLALRRTMRSLPTAMLTPRLAKPAPAPAAEEPSVLESASAVEPVEAAAPVRSVAKVQAAPETRSEAAPETGPEAAATVALRPATQRDTQVDSQVRRVSYVPDHRWHRKARRGWRHR